MLKIIKLHFRRIYGEFLEQIYKKELQNLPDGEYFLNHDVPCFTQWESKDLIDKILTGEIDTKDDPLWQQSGATNKEEYEMYSWQICGMTCLKMILGTLNPSQDFPLMILAKEAESSGVYVRNSHTDSKISLDGLFHREFLKFIRKFGLQGKLAFSVRENYLAHLIRENNFIIASVHPSIRDEIVQENSKGGHLILVTGFRKTNGKIDGFYINNPSGYFNQSQEKHFIPIEKWNRTFSGLIDVITPK